MKALICYNPKSGKQKVGNNLDYIKKRLKTKYENIDVYTTTGPKSIVGYLKENAKKYDLILISGGDGTLNETITGIIEQESRPVISYIPGGTCNDVGSMLNLKKRIKKAMDLTLSGEVVKMDICQANNKYFAYVVGSGKFIDISYVTPHKLKKRLGKVAYFLYGAKELNSRKKYHLSFEFDGTKKEGNYYVFLGMNSDHISGFHIFRKKHIKLNDGLINLTLIPANGLASFPKLITFMLRGERAFFKYGIEHYTVSEVDVKSSEAIDFNVDGELAFVSDECHIKVLKEQMRIIVPKKTKEKYF